MVWTKKLEVDHFVGPGSSPAATDTLLIVPCDGGDKQFVAALDLQTGDIRWQQDRPPIRSTNPDMRKANSTPLILPLNGRDVAIIPGAEWFVAYDAATGREVWRVSHDNGFSNVPRPVYDGQRLYLCSGYIRPRLFAVRTDGQGDVTKTHVAWQVAQQVPTMPSPVVVAGRIYMISDGGVASCLNAETGEVVWRERVDGKYSASLLAAAGRIYFCSQQGRTTVVAASDEFHVLARNELAGMLMASPAVLQGDLVLRTDSQLYRIDGK